MPKKIYINPGHSDADPGAVGYEVERNLNVKVSNYQKDYLLANYECEIRMNPGSIRNLYTVSEDANKWGADLFVSNHFNAGGGDGYEALVYSDARKEIGEIFEKHVKEIGQNSRGVKVRPGLIVLKATNMPAVLNEGAFVDNKKDIEDWNEDHELKKLGEAYAKATAEVLNLPAKSIENGGQTNQEDKPKVEPVSKPTVKFGDTGDDVKTVQTLLNKHGSNLKVDGSFGNLTLTAVKTFQKNHSLVVDGIVGSKTWSALEGPVDFKVRVSVAGLNIRTGPGTNYNKTGNYAEKGVYTIVEVKTGTGSNSGWGKLKSGAGWISLDYATRV